MANYKKIEEINENVWVEQNIWDNKELLSFQSSYEIDGVTKTACLYSFEDKITNERFYSLALKETLELRKSVDNSTNVIIVCDDLTNVLKFKTAKTRRKYIYELIKQHENTLQYLSDLDSSNTNVVEEMVALINDLLCEHNTLYVTAVHYSIQEHEDGDWTIQATDFTIGFGDEAETVNADEYNNELADDMHELLFTFIDEFKDGNEYDKIELYPIRSALENGGIVCFESTEPRYFKKVDNSILYSDDLNYWHKSHITDDTFNDSQKWSVL